MPNRCFQWVVVGLLLVVILLLGFMSFQTWNQQADHERPTQQPDRERPVARDNSSPRETGNGEEKGEPPDSSPTEGAQPPPARPDQERKEKPVSGPAEGAKTYQVDADASRIYVKVGSATRLGHPHGVEGKLRSGKIILGAGGELVFDMASFQADTHEARAKVGLEGAKVSENEAKAVNQTMRGADVLDVEKYPTSACKIIIIKPAEKQEAGAPGAYLVKGRLALHGAEQPLQFRAKVERTDKEGVLRLSGSFAIRQTDYGIKPYSAAGGLAKVADELEISGELWLGPPK